MYIATDHFLCAEYDWNEFSVHDSVVLVNSEEESDVHSTEFSPSRRPGQTCEFSGNNRTLF
jgi:hypothetical protein